jgi:hypothetical protein
MRLLGTPPFIFSSASTYVYIFVAIGMRTLYWKRKITESRVYFLMAVSVPCDVVCKALHVQKPN